MLDIICGDIFTSTAEALVNPVNCVGVIGAGLALQFKNRFPKNYFNYRYSYTAGELAIGSLTVTYENNKFIFNIPTKYHWRDKSTTLIIKRGLNTLIQRIRAFGIETVALPALGCELGGLSWLDVSPIFEDFLAKEKALYSLYLYS